MHPFWLSALLIVAFTSPASAAYDLGCQRRWSGPSADNDVIVCVESYPIDNYGLFAPAAIPLIFTIVFIVLFPIVFFGRCCGACGSNAQRPGADCCCGGAEWDSVDDEQKAAVYYVKPFHIFCIKLSALILVMLAVSTVIIVPIGASEAVRSWSYFLDHIETDVLDWIEDKKRSLIAGLQDELGHWLPSINNGSLSMVDDALAEARSIQETTKGATTVAVTYISYTVIAMCIFPVGGMLVVLLMAICNCRKCLPHSFQCLFFAFGVLYGLLSSLFLIAGLAFYVVHGEAVLQTQAEPGLFGWYVVPYCESAIKFQNIKDVVSTAVHEASVAGCRAVLQVCDGVPSTSNPNDKAQFYCPNLSEKNIDRVCNSPRGLSYVLGTVYSKSGSWVCSTSTEMRNCSIAECATECAVPEIRDYAASALAYIAKAQRALSLLNEALLYADCDVLIAQFVKPLSSFRQGGTGLYIAGSGLAVAMLCFMLATLILCKGQKVFVAKPSTPRSIPNSFSDEVVTRSLVRAKCKDHSLSSSASPPCSVSSPY